MASIFSFDPDPPRVASPWAMPGRSMLGHDNTQQQQSQVSDELASSDARGLEPILHTLGGSKRITKLAAEPQEGPTEYKLHLLLRPRRSLHAVSTGQHISGSTHSIGVHPSSSATASEANSLKPLPQAQTAQSRQHRLEQLTTQLLWRLQQSSPYHSSSTKSLVLPSPPPGTPELPPTWPGSLLPELVDSKGALYEIGVADDGTFVGLVEDEMEESLDTLRTMAASLGCAVEVLRRVSVGDCQWLEDVEDSGGTRQRLHTGKLWVAEALVQPDVGHKQPDKSNKDAQAESACLSLSGMTPQQGHSRTAQPRPQLRVSLTGATGSGKSSLLGTLSTVTLDNGRGKSRLSLLKHRHEIASGMTSSVAQELIGYREYVVNNGGEPLTEVINYATGNVSSWNDIHSLSEPGRLVFLSDSAGHPRYRRTAVRGLVGWAPHWALLCVAADEEQDVVGKSFGSSPTHNFAGSADAEVDLSKAHLELCLKLELPLVVIITKLDLASKSGLRQTLAKLLSTLKAAGKKPVILPNTTPAVTEADLQYIAASELADLRDVIDELHEDLLGTVPILLTSAVRGTGVRRLHALLHELPIMRPHLGAQAQMQAAASHPQPAIFHLEDIYCKPLQQLFVSAEDPATQSEKTGYVVSGHLSSGTLNVGDELLVGPFPSTAEPNEYAPQGNNTTTALFSPAHTTHRASPPNDFLPARILSLRNLRAPVPTLHTDQVGTAALVLLPSASPSHTSPSASTSVPTPAPPTFLLRKGMVLASPRAAHSTRTLTASFTRTRELDALAVGNHVVVYVASVRASAKVVCAALREPPLPSSPPSAPPLPSSHDGAIIAPAAPRTRRPPASNSRAGSATTFSQRDDSAAFTSTTSEDPDSNSDSSDSDDGTDDGARGPQTIDVTFRFITGREFVRRVDVGGIGEGEKVLVMPGGGPGLRVRRGRGEKGAGGLEGFVGVVVGVGG